MAFAVAVTWHAHPGAESRVEAVLSELATSTRSEPGCLTYQLHRAADGAGVYFIYEQFVDEAAFTAHIEAGYYKRLAVDAAASLLDRRERSLFSTIDPR
jgi:quinol monooxygenase YgiN